MCDALAPRKIDQRICYSPGFQPDDFCSQFLSKANILPANPAVASNGKDYLVVWNYFDMHTGGDIHGARVTADGQVADKDEIVISTAGDQYYPAIAGGSGRDSGRGEKND